MALVDDVSASSAAAMKAHDAPRLSTLRMLKAALVNRSVERGHNLDETESQQVVAGLVKQRRESIEQFLAGGRADLADKERAEIALLETYLPPALDPAEVEQAIDAAIAETGAASPKDLGRVMKAVMARLAGRGADGKSVNARVRERLGG
jgi:uncharacterized protein YqeY